MDKPDIKQFNEFITKAEERLGRKLKRTTGGKSDNHAVHGALDIGVNSNGLTHKEYLTLGLTASEFGFRVGDERETTHLHVDNTQKSKSGNPTVKYFERYRKDNGKTATRGTTDSVFQRMKEEVDKGMSFEDAINWGSYSDFNVGRFPFKDEEKPEIRVFTDKILASELNEVLSQELFTDMVGLSLSGNQRNPNAISDNLDLLGEIEIDNSDVEGTMKKAQEKIDKVVSKTPDDFQYPIRPDTQENLGGRSNYGGQPFLSSVGDFAGDFAASTIEAIKEDTDFSGMGANFQNQFAEENVLGLVGQAFFRGHTITGKVDPSFDPKNDPEMFKEALEGLSDDQAQSLLENYAYNAEDFLTVSGEYKERNKRVEEIKEYSKQHPVLSGTNALGNILVEAVTFAPVSKVIASAGLARQGSKGLKSIGTARKMGIFAGAEAVEGVVTEGVRAAAMEGYEVTPEMLGLFALGVVGGAGVNTVVDNIQFNKAIRELVDNERGFINLTTEQSKQLIKEVSSEVADKNALRMVNRLVKIKEEVANSVRKSLKSDHDLYVGLIDDAKSQMKASAKGSQDFKIAKRAKQKYTRELDKVKKAMPKEFTMLADGTHPALKFAVNPEMDVKAIAKEFNVPLDTIDNPEKLRDFLGLNGTRLGDDVVIQGEKGYSNVLRQQTEEILKNKRLNMNTFIKAVSNKIKGIPVDINLGVSKYLDELANTNSLTSKYLFNKGNLVSSDNPYVAGFYNLIGADGAGRQGMSKMRAGQSQQKYSKIFGGRLMNNYRNRGDELYTHLKGSTKRRFSFDDYEKTVEPLFNRRLRVGKKQFAIENTDPEIQRIVNDFADEYNKLNTDINDLLKRKGVEGVDFESSEDFIHTDWDFNKARAIDKVELEEGILNGMRKKLIDSGIEVDEKKLVSQAKKFTYGIRHADITKNVEAQKGYIDFLEKLVKKTDDASASITIKDEIRRLQTQKTASELGDFANKAMIDLSVPLPNSNQTLADLLEDNFVSTQKKYNNRMAARIAAAEHGIKDINLLDEWVDDAVEAEIKILAEANVPDPARSVKMVKESMEQDLKSFKHGHMAGRADLLEQDAHDVVRLANKYNFARLMQRVGIASIAELGGTANEVGLFNFAKRYSRKGLPALMRKLQITNPNTYTDELTDALSSITGIGLEDWAFSSKGVAMSERILKGKIGNIVEGVIDQTGAVTQMTLGDLETFNRKMTMNALANKWAKHFKGKDTDSLFKHLLGGSELSKRSFENVGLGEVIDGKLVKNARYKLVSDNFTKYAKTDDAGNLLHLNLEKWNKDAVDAFADTLVMQASHIMVDPDSVTSALWQNSTVGRIATQYQSFSRNARTKVFGYHMNNAAIGFGRGDYTEVGKAANVMFLSSVAGTLAIALNAELGSAFDGKGLATPKMVADNGYLSMLAIGLSRSSMIGGADTLIDTVGGSIFKYDPIFQDASFTNRSKNIGNLAASPLGQLLTGGVDVISKATEGDYSGAGKKALKLSPFQRQLGIQQLINYFNR